ncbi:GAF and ANTAR domain-containing protein [Actinoplanes sp. NPDC051633]|uniref:GAF and ANTAR domain-containing protein n=1 Tax=Actinoplanes sp. NPDC051633 TaxID=3155670 RepID=UPI003419D5C1
MANIDSKALADSLGHLRGTAGHDIVAAVDQAVHACAALFRVNGSGLMIADEQNDLHYIAASDGPSHFMEEVQSESGEGPCVDAFVTNDIVATDDLRSDGRWPAITDSLTRHNVVAMLGCPLRLRGVPVGTIDVYIDHPHSWDESERAALASYSDVIEATLSASMAAQSAGEVAGQLQYALDYRVVIERAVGFLMAQRRLDSVAAFTVLRRSARDQRRKIGDVAQELLDTGRLADRTSR